MSQSENQLANGMHADVPSAAYHADSFSGQPRLHQSLAKTLINRSPRHAYFAHPKLGGAGRVCDSSDAMDFGTVCHEIMIGKGGGFAVWSGSDWRGKEAGAFWDSAIAEKKTPIKRADYSRATEAVSEWRRQLTDMNIGYAFSQEGQSEVSIFWDETDTCACSARLDWLLMRENSYEIWDLKTTGDASPQACDRLIPKMGYDLQEEFYLRAVWQIYPKLTGKGKFRFLFAETEPPFAILPYETDGYYKGTGAEKAIEAIATWSDCMKSGKWPSYSEGIYQGSCPPWVEAQIKTQQ